MITRKLFLVPVLFLILFFTSCYGSWNPWNPDNNVDNRIETLSDLTYELPEAVYKSTGKYTVLIFTDLHYGSLSGNCPESKVFSWLDSIKDTETMPRFAISLGDSANSGSQSDYDEYLMFCKKLADDYGIQMLNVPGNHDLYQSHWDIWQKKLLS